MERFPNLKDLFTASTKTRKRFFPTDRDAKIKALKTAVHGFTRSKLTRSDTFSEIWKQITFFPPPFLFRHFALHLSPCCTHHENLRFWWDLSKRCKVNLIRRISYDTPAKSPDYKQGRMAHLSGGFRGVNALSMTFSYLSPAPQQIQATHVANSGFVYSAQQIKGFVGSSPHRSVQFTHSEKQRRNNLVFFVVFFISWPSLLFVFLPFKSIFLVLFIVTPSFF